ncbi:hypothetical protein ISN45_Aa01g000710 [Arabidopsis thaliana x Arabidopsis arenosa]|uniref:Uncharacterized protein n=1 Tax=Arabidopsis thaliana x Arabidopsis arenosa TaxID=1240361 RepID=A0A8T2A2V0_9BRAS|nr:hypothetical protein ISN45_Aa04g000910 [Arabidopsis thaliana x Arabidopsis arenosa]KAG7568708.1 hypothetical protein ISN45_Aa04g015040 [Arabidopsis thaliana x Arabidopsis arenosa]KAG7568709.1 hypothetical protein ISN45_Aa04g015050 [Arabidopsis thaliana x Arabidopsis arenosa]KAG7570527.1 hypothetical protein ISN45_Aa04g031150 [Arabidopsis thaliana x Arabidopsis arenosa]KAG7590995.1 hypothetical protein ISN45_Aa01g000710 [Arabidopsis thaliana x Arabidopsis arenosa]
MSPPSLLRELFSPYEPLGFSASTSIFKLHQYNVEEELNSSPFTTPSPHRCLHCFFQKISTSTWMHLKPSFSKVHSRFKSLALSSGPLKVSLSSSSSSTASLPSHLQQLLGLHHLFIFAVFFLRPAFFFVDGCLHLPHSFFFFFLGQAPRSSKL